MSVESAPMEAQSAGTVRIYPVLKRLGDIVASLAALAILSPVFVLIALLVKVQDRGPVFYCHDRVGRGGRLFRFYKFRSMVSDADRIKADLSDENEADGPIFKMKQDPRVTRVGRILRRFSLDELPQFWNVLRGDMSLVGPRPHLPSEIAACPDYPRERFTVPPGLICLREVNGRSQLTFAEWLESDLEYVRRRSVWLDLHILLRAIPAIVFARGAY
jgi:lipopolysaccharide/colanic/teichoic acid biosynthesis glycosyltransferase